ncbi:hypothetical protein [Luteibacter yeojuensis]|uniref:Uncharacterized protein n=1 Tax=Luteibacter yeojuensis TaxID=345309 RepID=A0A7X5QVM9_9GAMM|nr:hypothetical protein [Luteibacter yeojuensis]NID16221.1 hypothetical protein [Luteibacter yeojuensis]
MNHAYLVSVRTGIFALALCAGAALAGTPEDTSQPFDRYSWVTTHNAFTSNGLIPNQNQTIDEQLAAGVRGLMLDLYYHEDRVRLCHNRCRSGSRTLADLFITTLLPFLDENGDAIVTLHLEDYTSLDQLTTELNKVPGLGGRTFDPYAWPTDGWPTYKAMLERGQRILIFSHNWDSSGTLTTRSGDVHIMPSEDFTVENYWSLGTTVFTHDPRCYSRWEHQPLASPEIPGMPGWRPLFTMNQFHGVPIPLHHDNRFDTLVTRYRDYCWPAAQRKPNYVAVDFHEKGDTRRFVDWLNAQADGTKP